MTPAKPSPRPLWFLGPGGVPIAATGKKSPRDVTHFAFEGDLVWSPVHALPSSPGPVRTVAPASRLEGLS